MNPKFDPDDPLHTLYQQQNADLARFDAAMRGEYHQRFRSRVVAIVGADAPDPQHLQDFRELAA
jgi:hypothetical protein